MIKKYKCNLCGIINNGKWMSTPAKGDYIRVKCRCGNSGSSEYLDSKNWYFIDGFTEVK
jgi:hypothetical protein